MTEDWRPYIAPRTSRVRPTDSTAAIAQRAATCVRASRCRDRSPRSRVCAFGALIVHRDLKPSNILVDHNGVHAAGLRHRQAARTRGVRKTIARRVRVQLTPEYASPEQVRGRPVTTRTDVYSLGVILFELLAGERAQMARPVLSASLDRSICEHDPGKPSDPSARRRTLARRLRGDLDTIVSRRSGKSPNGATRRRPR